MKPKKPFKVVSLFSGCGGMDLGFEGGFIVHEDSINPVTHPGFLEKRLDGSMVRLAPTGFQTVFANDILQEARHAWVHYFSKRGYSPGVYRVQSLVELVKAHKRGTRVFPEGVEVVTGGFPCQDFSIAGKRSGFDSRKDHTGQVIRSDAPSVETRGQLYMWLREVVEIVRPKIFIAENVKGLVNLSNVREVIRQDFASTGNNGYLVLDPMVLQAADYGVPQSRERVIFIGIRKSELAPAALEALSRPHIPEAYDPYPRPSHAYTREGDHLMPPVKLRAIFKDLPEPEHSDDASQSHYSKAKFMGDHCQGQTEIDPGGVGPTIRAEHHGNIEFRRLSVGHGGKIHDELSRGGLKERRLTPRECALIQTFPPDYEFVIPSRGKRFLVSPSSAYRLIGNAVPPLLAYHLARRIESLWELYFNIQYPRES